MAKERRLIKSRGPVVKLDRLIKAKMINAFLTDYLKKEIKNLNILDVGCGNGQISNFFSQSNNVYAVDINDKRENKNSNYSFKRVSSEELPFGDNKFDIIISHHVIEHVKNQDLHIKEIIRTLKSDGIIYLACPNKSSPFMAGHIGNNQVLTLKELHDLFKKFNLAPSDYYGKLLKHPHQFYCEITITRFIPTILINALKKWYPSQCFILSKKTPNPASH